MVKKSVISQLIKSHELDSLERHLVYAYLASRQLSIAGSPILKKYFKGFVPDPQLSPQITALAISSIKELENYLELMIPAGDRKLNGAFFTPSYIVDFIISEMKPGEQATNLDPSCGCGAFLVGLAEYYRRIFNKPVRRIVKENIFGADILAYNIRRAKLILTLYALQHGEHLAASDFNLYHRDSLRTAWKQSFDTILGNPPYVKFQDLSEENRDYLVRRWTTIAGGSFNLYFAFFELGHRLLKPGGKLGYITPNNYFTSLAGEALRSYFHQQQCVVRIVDFSHKKVFDAQTYTAITFLDRQPHNAILYDRIQENQTPEAFLATANGSPNDIENLDSKKWRLLKTEEQRNIRIIETAGTPIGRLFDINVGIATLKDDIFFIDGRKKKNGYYIKTTAQGDFEIEKAATMPVYRIPDFAGQEEITTNSRRIIFPYRLQDGSASPIPEKEFKKEYPMCYAYLLSEKKQLKARDKAKKIFEPFYIWGRSQGLTRKGIRLLTPTFSQRPRFLLVQDERSFFTNGYGIFCRSNADQPIARPENIDVVQKILNSCVMDYYVRSTSVAIEHNYPCYQKNFIQKFTVPDLTEKEIGTIRGLQDAGRIDEWLLEKYRLNVPEKSAFSF